MFTGLVTDIGTVVAAEHSNAGLRMRVRSSYDAATVPDGASIACDGVCLTVVESGTDEKGSWFDFDAVPETLGLSTFADVAVGDRINLERPLTLGDELGGHAVLGHVDGMAEIISREVTGTSTVFGFRVAADLARFIARKGSVTLNGTSLTVTDVSRQEFAVAIIPHTIAVTNWDEKTVGDKVNLEIDVLARYMQRLIETSDTNEKAGQ